MNMQHRATIAEARAIIGGVKGDAVTLTDIDRYQQWLRDDGVSKLIDAAQFFADTSNN